MLRVKSLDSAIRSSSFFMGGSTATLMQTILPFLLTTDGSLTLINFYCQSKLRLTCANLLPHTLTQLQKHRGGDEPPGNKYSPIPAPTTFNLQFSLDKNFEI